jgi:hypothetical protein
MELLKMTSLVGKQNIFGKNITKGDGGTRCQQLPLPFTSTSGASAPATSGLLSLPSLGTQQ